MDWLQQHLLTGIIFMPTFGAGIILLLPAGRRELFQRVALGSSLVTFLLSYMLFVGFRQDATFQFIELLPWISAFGMGISYHVGVDGISLMLIMLTTFLTPITILSAFDSIDNRVRGFMVALLVMETGMLGVFASLYLFLFYMFW